MNKIKQLMLGALCCAGILAGVHPSQAATINVSGQLTGVQNWTANNEYVLNGYVYVLDGGVLNIQAGTVIRGVGGVAPNFGALYICRGAKINALGTRLNPIIFTSDTDIIADPFDIPFTAAGRGLWGGVVILGKGLINRADAAGVNGNQATDPSVSGNHLWQIYEGLADVNGSDGKPLHRFGGADNDDNSGCMRYVSIRHSGKALSADKEINGLSMGGVGRKTVIEFVEAYQGADDGFEWWGGAVNTRYLVSTFVDDEMFDMDEGHIGHHQFWFGIQGIAGDEGMELNGQPSGAPNVNTVGALPRGRHQIYNATLIGNPADGGNDAMNTRSEYFGEIRNSVFTEFSGSNQVSSVTTYNGTVVNNLFFANTAGNGRADTINNTFVNPLLTAIDRTQGQLLDPTPQAGSPVFSGFAATPIDGHFTPAPYKGAFNLDENWMHGWTALSKNQHIKPQATAATINISGQLTGVHNWTANNTYVLNGYVYVLDGGVLNIEAGTIIRGAGGVAPNFGALYICRGGKINAVGSPSAPIIFTSLADNIADPFDIPFTAAGRGLWGGVVILGKGLINRADAAGVNGNQATDLSVPGNHLWQIYEGLADVNGSDGKPLHRFGGADNTDNSGIMKYVSIRHSGKALSADKEINGLSMGGVGSGTIIECVEAYQGADDGFEFWGGAVNTRYLVSTFVDDEMFDMDEGHSGKHQFWFGIQGIAGDEGMELNGQPSGAPNANIIGALPRGVHELYNVTLIGNPADGGNDVMNTRSEYFGEIRNSIFTLFSGSNQVASVTRYQGTVRDNIFFANTAGNGRVDTLRNVFANPLITAVDRTQSELLNPLPQAGSPAFSDWRVTPVNGHFERVAFKGAFDQELWCQDWTALGDNLHLAYNRYTAKSPLPVAQPTVAVAGDNVTVSWTSAPGMKYQVQVSTDLGATFANDGAAQLNSGEENAPMTHASNIAGVGTKKQFRVITSINR